MEKADYGFVAFWKAADSWFCADQKTKDRFMEALREIMEEARSKGIRMLGTYDCSWSSQWRYFTFWQCPDIEVLQATMKRLADIGDINHFNIQHHYVGRKVLEDLVQ